MCKIFMKIFVKVTPNARKTEIAKEGEVLKVRLAAPAVDGKANSELLAVLAAHFGVRKSSVTIVKGRKSRNKVIDITGKD